CKQGGAARQARRNDGELVPQNLTKEPLGPSDVEIVVQRRAGWAGRYPGVGRQRYAALLPERGSQRGQKCLPRKAPARLLEIS
nr:hypothetical protein [Tanacetum cinerariifolium]